MFKIAEVQLSLYRVHHHHDCARKNQYSGVGKGQETLETGVRTPTEANPEISVYLMILTQLEQTMRYSVIRNPQFQVNKSICNTIFTITQKQNVAKQNPPFCFCFFSGSADGTGTQLSVIHSWHFFLQLTILPHYLFHKVHSLCLFPNAKCSTAIAPRRALPTTDPSAVQAFWDGGRKQGSDQTFGRAWPYSLNLVICRRKRIYMKTIIFAIHYSRHVTSRHK